MAELTFSENKEFHHLMSGGWLNPATTRAFLAEVLKVTVGPGGIAQSHFQSGQGTWARLSRGTVNRKKSSKIFFETGRTQTAISTSAHGGTLSDWGSSADIYSKGSWTPKRYSKNGIYASVRATKKDASLTVGFNGRYKMSSGFNTQRRKLASAIAGRKVTNKEARKLVSVGSVERRLKGINADRKARGLKTIKKTAALGSSGFKSGRHILARGNDNLAYADIVQRGKFKGIRSDKGDLFSPKGISSRARSGKATKGTAVFGVARSLLPYRGGDVKRIEAAMQKAMNGMAAAMNGR